jgi:hypothetical protein
MTSWCFLNYTEGQACFVNWTAAQTISSTLLALALVGVTIYYAIQTHRQVKAMQDQVTAIQNQVKAMQDQLIWDQTYKPRLDAYTRFMEALISHSADTAFLDYVVFPQLGLVQPYSSDSVKTKAKELYDFANSVKRGTSHVPSSIVGKINTELIPIITDEIEEIMRLEEAHS